MKTVKLGTLLLMVQFSLAGCVTVKKDGGPVVKADPIAMAESRIALGLGYLEGGSNIRAHDNLQQALTHAPDYYRAQLSMEERERDPAPLDHPSKSQPHRITGAARPTMHALT